MSGVMTIQTFIGYRLGPEMRMHLDKSKLWKLAAIAPVKDREMRLQDVHFCNKDYFGCYLSHEIATIKEIKVINEGIKSLLKNYCPEYSVESLTVYVFPQIFIA